MGSYRIEDDPSAGRQPVAHLQALGQTQLLELAYVRFEGQPLALEGFGQIARPDTRSLVDQPKYLHRPRAARAAGIESGQPPAHLGDFFVRQDIARTQLDT